MNSTQDIDISVEDTELISGLLDGIVLLWMGIQPNVNKVISFPNVIKRF